MNPFDYKDVAKGTARLHRRARIETDPAGYAGLHLHAPPAFTGGRGLKLRGAVRLAGLPVHRPPSPAGAD